MPDNPFLHLAPAGDKGLGVFAARAIVPGPPILTFRGPRLTADEVRDFSHSLQIGPDVFLGPSEGLDDYINHSCAPNCGLRERDGELDLVAIRLIRAGEELSFDYSTCMVDEPCLEGCRCGAPRCRGVVATFRDLPHRVQRLYVSLGVVPRFVLDSAGWAPLVAARRDRAQPRRLMRSIGQEVRSATRRAN